MSENGCLSVTRGRSYVLLTRLDLEHPAEIAVRRPAGVTIFTIDGGLHTMGDHRFSIHVPLVAGANTGGVMAAGATFRSHHRSAVGLAVVGQTIVLLQTSGGLRPFLEIRFHRGIHQKNRDDVSRSFVRNPLGRASLSAGKSGSITVHRPLRPDQLVILEDRVLLVQELLYLGIQSVHLID